MNAIDTYISGMDEKRKAKVCEVVAYIRKAYPHFAESCDYAPKTKFPVFKSPDSPNYIGIASQKSYISIHFGRYHCTEIVAAADKRIKSGVGCAKIPDSVPFPIENIKRAIDACAGG